AFVGSGSAVEIRYNTKLVQPREFTSYWDLLHSKWKGKIAGTDPRIGGMDSLVVVFYYHPGLGPDFMRRLYGDMDVTLSRDYRQPIDWLASGKFSLCMPCNSRESRKAMKQGLPIGEASSSFRSATARIRSASTSRRRTSSPKTAGATASSISTATTRSSPTAARRTNY
ncbi:MAG TPA: hypothetical protein VL754_00705, partial [Verrucomicrobiae bacterium]|nr:hypothetical protein [Verrucomicrobiae bacterium]